MPHHFTKEDHHKDKPLPPVPKETQLGLFVFEETESVGAAVLSLLAGLLFLAELYLIVLLLQA